ncbi:c-type cytochrome biogenesis protein CcsB [Actinomadura madurae]|uniref:c-type cytochrome biogenesis protein CcsB n=1 Tax=Actinomadura madurae TaxID=1993 RepID=UPI0020271E60|nr:c-type cytochrome biogenesis protein CcsB [Actinomadura madurae]URM98341.1 c-type cytochrome biogenesis protein CcsB [Actinomadura madurae]URN09033.1 c-type cytochrome biogenesis protein CcsB [Actinomadura madurae]
MSNADLANLSDKLMLTTVVMYVIALVAYAADLGFGRRRAVAGAAAEAAAVPAKAGAKVLVGSAGAAASDGAPAQADAEMDAEEDAAERPRVDWVRLAVLLNVLGWGAHLGVLVTRGLAANRWPWGNMYEFLTAISFAAVTAFIVVMLRYNARFLGAFVMAAAAIALGVANIWLYDSVGPVSPALNSYWIAIHVTAAIVATGSFTVAGAATVLYLVKDRAESRGGVAAGGVLSRIPSVESLDRLSMRVTMFAFPIWTAAIIMGAIWADQAWGRYWGWDPKEIWSFITWVVYAAYLHARATAGWRGRKAAYLSLLAFAALLFNFFGVNYMFSGLHSYA